MGKFVKGMKRPPGAGRKKGAPNRVTVTVRNAWEAAFGKLQRDKERNLLAWAKDSPENLKVFYGLSTKLLPMVEVNLPEQSNLEAMPVLEIARRVAFVMSEAERLGKKEGPRLVTGEVLEFPSGDDIGRDLYGQLRTHKPEPVPEVIPEAPAPVPQEPDAYQRLSLAREASQIWKDAPPWDVSNWRRK